MSSQVRTGFVNALAILIFAAHCRTLHGASVATWGALALGPAASSTAAVAGLKGWRGQCSRPFRHP